MSPRPSPEAMSHLQEHLGGHEGSRAVNVLSQVGDTIGACKFKGEKKMHRGMQVHGRINIAFGGLASRVHDL